MIRRLFRRYSSLRYVLSSIAAFAVDNGLYYVFLHLVFAKSTAMSAVAVSTCSQIAARLLSSFFNFNCNNFLVFHSREKYSSALFRYYCLCVPQALVSVILLDTVIVNIQIGSDLLQTLLKIAIEAILFVISYLIQNKWVFSTNKKQ